MESVCFPSSRAFAKIDIGAIERNFCLLRSKAQQSNPRVRVIAVVKANAYGHGVALVVPALYRTGCDFFAVATPDEGLTVRELAPDADILVLGYTPPVRAPELADAGITQTVFSAPYAAALSATMTAVGGSLPIHLKIDGGMCRLGFAPDDRAGLLRVLRRRGLAPTGIYTHFPVADTDTRATKASLDRFLSCHAALKKEGFPLFAHAAASAATLTLPESILDGIRPGLSLYGISPVQTALQLTPALSLHAPIVQIHTVPTGTPVGYGGDFITNRNSRIGTLPLGYADGFPRALSGLTATLSHSGKEYPVPVVGRVSMDQLTVDLTDTPALVGDTVCLWRDATAIAAQLGTIPYEVLTALSPRVGRVKI